MLRSFQSVFDYGEQVLLLRPSPASYRQRVDWRCFQFNEELEIVAN